MQKMLNANKTHNCRLGSFTMTLVLSFFLFSNSVSIWANFFRSYEKELFEYNVAAFPRSIDGKSWYITFEIPKSVKYIDNPTQIRKFHNKTGLFGSLIDNMKIAWAIYLTDEKGDVLIEYSFYPIRHGYDSRGQDLMTYIQYLTSKDILISNLVSQLMLKNAKLKDLQISPFQNKLQLFRHHQLKQNLSLSEYVLGSEKHDTKSCYTYNIRAVILDKYMVNVVLYSRLKSPYIKYKVKRIIQSMSITNERPHEIIDSAFALYPDNKNYNHAFIGKAN
jgi:hypothetical protein